MPAARKRVSLRLIIALVLGIVVLSAALPWITARAPLPLIDSVRVVETEIYQHFERARRVPADLALPRLAQASALQFVKLLPLEEEVRDRIEQRLISGGFVHEMVPFLLTVKDMYVAPGEQRAEGFDAYVRSSYQPADEVPGMQHSMFAWTPDAPSAVGDDAGFGINLDLAAQLLTVYDALYLQDQDATESMDERLACSAAEIEARLEPGAARVKPALRQLLTHLRDGMEAGSELRDALDTILEDESRLDTVGLSVVQFVDLMVCKHYQMFASRAVRQQQLESWLEDQLERPLGGRLWSYLSQAQHDRRYGALIVVDGLQGHLVEALAGGSADSLFIQQIWREQSRGEVQLRNHPPARDLQQQTRFLRSLSSRGFQHPAYLPFFRDLYADTGADDPLHPTGISRSGISTTPTISVRNLPVVKTGAPVAGNGATGVPNFHFVDRDYERNGIQQGRAYYFFGNDALQLTTLTQRAGMRTLFERLPARSSYSCAAQYDDWAQAGIDPFLNLALGEAIRDFGEVLCFTELAQRAENEVRLQSVREELLAMRDRLGVPLRWYDWYHQWGAVTAKARARQLIENVAELESRGLPELLVYYNPWPDHFAHFKGPFSDEIIAPSGELARLDFWLGRLSRLYAQAGVARRTLFGMAGDHGLAPVFQLESPTARVLDPLQERGVPLSIIKISSDEGEGPKLTHVLEPPSMRDYDVVIASTAGGNLMLDLFIDQEARWSEQPLEADLRDWRPAAWLNNSAADKSVDLIDELLDGLGDTLDYLAVRVAASNPAQTTTGVYGPGGSGLLMRRGQRIYYAFTGEDLLDTSTLSPYEPFTDEERRTHGQLYQRCVVDPVKDNDATWCSESDWRLLTASTSRPDSVVQLAHLYDLDRAGSVNLFPAYGVAYNSIVPGRHAGESFHEKDAFVGVWGHPVARAAPESRLRTALGGSVPIAIYEYLIGEPITEREDGWGYPSLWTELYPVR